MSRKCFKTTGNLLSMEIYSSITRQKYKAICREIEEAAAAAATGTVRLLLIMRHYPTFSSAEDLYYDLRFIMIYSDRIEKVAVVGDKPWKRTWVALFGLFSRVCVEFFDIAHLDRAKGWLAIPKAA
ncbi:MAG: STAS/SEC14 domain-containing protein [Desulfobacteraceae bacterium]|nr:STAS/SEC14 domain-containing protein [Desulfobacteraceae bacterium]